MSSNSPEYGLWLLVTVNVAVFLLFAFSFFRPRSAPDWRTLGTFSAFIVALFVEMYGFPLTLYLLAGWIGSRYPAIDPMSHDAGHLWPLLFGWSADPHWSPFHLLSFVLIGGGFLLVAKAWRVLHEAQCHQTLAVDGPYAYLRNPQYMGFALIMIGLFLQWPTLLTGAMLPGLLIMYARLAHREELEVEAQFGEQYRNYATRVPAFIPRPGELFNFRPH
jgi:methanethiol S-methyltransferase